LLTRNGCARTPARRAIAYPRAPNRHRADAGHDLALGRWPWRTRRRRPSSLTSSVCRASKVAIDRLREKRTRPIAQHLSQRISKSPWLGKLQTVSVGACPYLPSMELRNTDDMPPHPFVPSPTFEDSSLLFYDKNPGGGSRESEVQVDIGKQG
jgi:hypothetical protein